MQYFKIILFLIIGFFNRSFAQLEQSSNYGFNVGVVSALGTHIQNFGIVVQGYYVYKFTQINASLRIYDSFKNIGPQGEHAEINTAFGICIGYGKKTKEENLFVTSITNHTGYKNSVAYSYNIWLNKIKTSQVTGIVSLQFNKFSFINENDLFAKPMLDRFRTGAMLIQYQYKQYQFSINATMWTGQLGNVVKFDSLFPYAGYMNTDKSVYSNLSHGLLSGQVKYANEYGQYIQANAGIDAEQVRNFLQNKALHDLIPNNYHIPMVDTEGNQYLYKPTQHIRKPKIFLNAFTCPNVFY